jgi:putative membrane-bound dehydrogenase-like protein
MNRRLERQVGVCLLLAVALSAFSQDEGRSPEETAKALKVPEGFSVKVFAAEPDLRQPIGFCFDDRGRVWVAENYSYPNWKTTGEDRILIFEDADGDGRFDKRTVFYDKLNYVTGLEVGFGGVWAVSAPHLLFIPDRDGDDRPDGEPVVELEGFGHQGVHNLVNGCTWGPDGWLYGGHGGTSSGKIGRPGAADDRRVFFDGGVWRYHPTKKVFESFMEGTTNPWGVDFDDYGMAFISNSVTPHLYHVIQGSHVERRRESQSSRYAYGVIDSIADHKHWVGGKWEDSRGGTAEQTAKQIGLGGGHAHSGCMVYLSDNWPDRYRGSIFMINIHGDRMNNDLPRRRASGFIASHGEDLLVSGDPWFMGLQVKYGPDGAVYVSDWYDTGECHTRRPETGRGRIYRISYGTAEAPRRRADVSKMTGAELVGLQLDKNEWWGRRARRVLQERGADAQVHEALRAMLRENPDVTRRLRALWGLHVSGGTPETLLRGLLPDESEYVRAWAIQSIAEDRQPTPEALVEFERMSREDPSPLVRLYLASAIMRLPVERRWAVMEGLVSHEQDAGDANLPLMYWYALEPMAVADGRRALALAGKGKSPKLREFVARRLAEKAR